MSLLGLQVENLRCLRQLELELDPAVNLLVGPNGSGKTSILEAIYLLGRGRSFRTRHADTLIRHGSDALTVAGRTAGDTGIPLRVRARRFDGVSAEIAAVAVRSRADLAQALPVQALEPGIHKLIEEASPRRRRW